FGDRHVCPVASVHAQHAKALRMSGRESAEPHQRRRDRKAETLGKLQKLARSVCVDDSAAHVEYRPPRGHHSRDRPADAIGVDRAMRSIAAQCGTGWINKLRVFGGDVLWYVHDDGTGASGACDVKRFIDYRPEFFGVLNKVVVLCAWPGYANGVDLLKGVGADHLARYLSGD